MPESPESNYLLAQRVAALEAQTADIKLALVEARAADLRQSEKIDELIKLVREAKGGWSVLLFLTTSIGGLLGVFIERLLLSRG